MRKAYWDALQKKLLSEHELEAALHGIDLRGDKVPGGKYSKEEAMAYMKNPLKDFPNDIDYSQFKEEGLDFHRKEYAAFARKNPRPLTFEESKLLWTPERIDALQGNDPVAKRASVKGELWALYLEMRKHKDPVTLDDILAVLKADLKVLQLVPSPSEMSEYNKDRPRDKLYSLYGIVSEIPTPHLQRLFKENRFPQELMCYV